MTKSLVTIAMCVALCVSTAWGTTDEEACLAGRAKAAGDYNDCVQAWLAKIYSGGDYFTRQPQLGKCRIRYAAAWPKLQRLTDSTTCGGQPRFVDNANGTITDNLTGLMWEKKSRNGDIHDWGNFETWSAAGPPYIGDGSAYTTFLRDELNAGSGFAGANDWRLPTLAELQSILLPEPYPCTTSPCVHPVFHSDCVLPCSVLTCSCDTGAFTWSASSFAPSLGGAWLSHSGDGFVGLGGKTVGAHVRAVRGGL